MKHVSHICRKKNCLQVPLKVIDAAKIGFDVVQIQLYKLLYLRIIDCHLYVLKYSQYHSFIKSNATRFDRSLIIYA